MKRITTALFILLSYSAFPQQVSLETAKKVTINFCKENQNEAMSKFEFSEIKAVNNDDLPAFYILNLNNNAGFVIVSASMKSKPILGYSFESAFDFDNIHSPVNNLFDNYKQEIKYLEENTFAIDSKISSEWQQYLNNNSPKENNLKANLAPFHKIMWGQGCNYNELCPAEANSGTGYCGHAPTGCGATVMSEIMRYYNYPVTGAGSNLYIPILYPLSPLTANFGNTTYHWSKMPYAINSSNPEIAQIMFHSGVSVSMQYSANGSGALHADVLDAWINHFKYAPSAVWLKKTDYPVDSVWNALIIEDLDSLRPVFYYGTKSGGTIFDGHYFILDGYQNNDYFHINWGWSGSDNGYFYLNALTPSGSNFNQDGQFIKGLKPIGSYCVDKKYGAATGTFDDGSDTNNYFENGDCSYTVQVTGAVTVYLDFTAFDVAAGDTLYIYNGLNSTAPLLAKYSGNEIPPSLISTVGKIFLNFVTDGSDNSSGWAVTYNAYYSDIKEESTDGFSIYPNPCNNSFNVNFSDEMKGKAKLSVFDLSGRLVKTETFIINSGELTYSVNTGNIANGTYFLRIESNDHIYNGKANIIH
jgi:hypothetical protein